MDETVFAQANARGHRVRSSGPYAVSARYLPLRKRLVVTLSTGAELSVPTADIEGLGGAAADDLRVIEVSPTGTGLHFPRLDADVYVPALIAGVMGSVRWMAQQMERAGGGARTERKGQASRENGKRGGRPKARVVEPAP